MRLHSKNWKFQFETNYTGWTLKLHILFDKRPKMTKSNLTVRNLSVEPVYMRVRSKKCLGPYDSAFNFFNSDHIRVHSWKNFFLQIMSFLHPCQSPRWIFPNEDKINSVFKSFIKSRNKTEQANTESKSNIVVQWRRKGQPISNRHFHYLSY